MMRQLQAAPPETPTTTADPRQHPLSRSRVRQCLRRGAEAWSFHLTDKKPVWTEIHKAGCLGTPGKLVDRLHSSTFGESNSLELGKA